jgi:hypothetical protein
LPPVPAIDHPGHGEPVRRPSAGLPGYLASLPRRSASIRELSVRFHLTSQTENDKVGAYMIGNIVVSIIVGLAAFAALARLGVPFAVPPAFVVAVTDLIPMIGATLGAAAWRPAPYAGSSPVLSGRGAGWAGCGACLAKRTW